MVKVCKIANAGQYCLRVIVSLDFLNATSDVDYIKLYACGSAFEGHRSVAFVCSICQFGVFLATNM